ncbi:hypothetical protein [Noviherbaspirillum malthae]|uniref:hypothetical protein n=1 Tax=Noviherbaspirillum malthae TaxID=1260987 RepID=UPI00188F6249|nr:hypothetical protein [Noviherbaspirillum malthae]
MVSSPTLRNPSTMVPPSIEKNPQASTSSSNKEFSDAKLKFLEEIHNLYPTGKMGINDDRQVFFDKKLLEHIRNGERINDTNGKPYTPSPELQNAARILLENDAPSSINPNGDPWFNKGDLERSIAPSLFDDDKGNAKRGDIF